MCTIVIEEKEREIRVRKLIKRKLIKMKLLLLLSCFSLQAAELRKITRSPKIECMRSLDVTLHAAEALGISQETVERLIMKRVDNYDKIATVAFPLKGQNLDEVKRYLLQQAQE